VASDTGMMDTDDDIDAEWCEIAREIKEQIWGVPSEPEWEMALDKFSPITGEVHEDWDSWAWVIDRMAGCKRTTTRRAHTVLRP